jgi:hypothetical protein
MSAYKEFPLAPRPQSVPEATEIRGYIRHPNPSCNKIGERHTREATHRRRLTHVSDGIGFLFSQTWRNKGAGSAEWRSVPSLTASPSVAPQPSGKQCDWERVWKWRSITWRTYSEASLVDVSLVTWGPPRRGPRIRPPPLHSSFLMEGTNCRMLQFLVTGSLLSAWIKVEWRTTAIPRW